MRLFVLFSDSDIYSFILVCLISLVFHIRLVSSFYIRLGCDNVVYI